MMWKLIKVLTILLGLFSWTRAQVLGIDFGTEFWKAALISPGKNLVIIENSRSERKTLNSVAFHEGQRFFEEEAMYKRIKKPQLSYFYLNRLIRSLDTDNPVQGYEFNGETYVFEDGDKEMSLEQVVAMILKDIKGHASKQAGTDIRDVVLTVPTHWGFKAKMSLVNAAYLADLSVLSLINENSAAAIQYAITRNDTDPFNVMFFNLGSHNLQVSIIKMFGFYDEARNKTIQSIEALIHVSAENVGGLEFDQKIAAFLASTFHQKHKMNPTENVRSFTKLLVKSAEVKETLSANKETQVYIEGLMEGLDLSAPVSRSVIEDDPVTFQIFTAKIQEALNLAKLTKQDIGVIQLIGGASRIPKVATVVKSYFPETQVGAHINGDEAMAFGSALRAANLSLTFKVKQLHFYDPMNLDTRVVISSTDRGVISEQTLFSVRDHHGAKKTVSLPENSQDLKITVYVGEEIVKEFASKGLGDWKEKFEGQNITAEPNTVIEFMMSSIHIAEIKEFYVNVTLNVTEVKEKVEYVDEEVLVEEEEQKGGDAEKIDNEEAKNAEQIPENVKPDEQQAATEDKQEEGQKEAKPKTKKVTKTIKKQVEEFRIEKKKQVVSFDETFSKYKRFTKEDSQEKKKIIREYEKFEKELKEKSKVRNDFQSALYRLKDDFEQQYMKTFGKEEEVDKLKETVTAELQWMDENAWTADKSEFESHFRTLTEAYNPIYNRTAEYQGREKTYNESLQYFGAVYKKTSELLTSHPWIEDKINEQLSKINSTVKTINQKLSEQMKRALNENPLIYNIQMISKAEALRDEYYLLRLIPRPKTEKKTQASTQKQQNAQEDSEQQQETDQEEASQQEAEDSEQTKQQNEEEQKTEEEDL